MTIEEIIDLLKKDKAQRGDCLISDAIDIVVKMLEQEPFINKACVSTNACKHDKEVALNKIKVVAVRHGFTRMIGILICIIVLIAKQRRKKARINNELF